MCTSPRGNIIGTLNKDLETEAPNSSVGLDYLGLEGDIVLELLAKPDQA